MVQEVRSGEMALVPQPAKILKDHIEGELEKNILFPSQLMLPAIFCMSPLSYYEDILGPGAGVLYPHNLPSPLTSSRSEALVLCLRYHRLLPWKL